jgi:hypothetical protein
VGIESRCTFSIFFAADDWSVLVRASKGELRASLKEGLAMNRTRGAPPGARLNLDLLMFGLSIATVLWIVVGH